MFLMRQELRARASQMVVFGFAGRTLSAELKELLREVQPLGLILFERNIESAEQVAELNREIKQHVGRPLLLCVDQEGGRVARVRAPATAWPPMRALGRAGDPALARAMGAALACEVRALNFDVDFAPVLDVDTNPDNPIIGARAISPDAACAARLGAAFIAGMEGAGVGACGKHFPGHGDTALDSHLDLPYVAHPLAQLQAREWLPFAAAIAAGVGAIMTAHVVVSEVDPLPATLSRTLLTDHLRRALGFGGAIVSDDIEMRAVADRFAAAEIAARGAHAGVDVFLACHTPETILGLYRGLVTAAESGAVTHAELDAAGARAAAWQARFAQPPVRRTLLRQTLGCAAHAELAARLHADGGFSAA